MSEILGRDVVVRLQIMQIPFEMIGRYIYADVFNKGELADVRICILLEKYMDI